MRHRRCERNLEPPPASRKTISSRNPPLDLTDSAYATKADARRRAIGVRRCISIVLVLSVSTPAAVGGVFPAVAWAFRTPAEAGLDANRLADFSAAVGGRGCIVRGGYMVHTWGDQSLRQDISSASKPWYAHFLYQAVETGLLTSVDELAVNYQPCLDSINAALGFKDRLITFRHLANQISGYGFSEMPGAAFAYNDFQMAMFWDTLFLGVYGATYDTVDAAVLHPVTEAMQFQDNPTFLAFGASDRPGRMRMSVRDFARFGLLYLNLGNWNGTQLIGSSWVQKATGSPLPAAFPITGGVVAEMCPDQRTIGGSSDQSPHMGSYSWLWWVNGVDENGTRLWPAAPADAYGAFGHWGKRVLFVIPSLDLVVSYNDSTLNTIAMTNQVWAILMDAVWPPARLELVADRPCVQTGGTLTVTLRMADLSGFVAAGYEAHLGFDTTRLTFVSGAYTNAPFGLHLITPVTAPGGGIDLAASIDQAGGQTPTSLDADLATMTFVATSEDCAGSSVTFVGGGSPSNITDISGAPPPVLVTVDTAGIVIDGDAPLITCPPDVTTSADAGGCDSALDPGTATAVDNCDGVPTVTASRGDALSLTDPFPSGGTAITWTATDACSHASSCQQVVTVSAVNDLTAVVELSPTFSTGTSPDVSTRCITFELFDCAGGTSVVVSRELDFAIATGAPTAAAATVQVPCGHYDCITATDRLHTLTRNDEAFGIVGVRYATDLTGDVAAGGDWLVGGDLNDDGVVDIFDFGIFAGQWNAVFGSSDTACGTAPPQADISGNGSVSTEDFTFIQIHFLEVEDVSCCGMQASGRAPVVRISVAELHRLGLDAAAPGDLNGDGWVDIQDVAAMVGGARPGPRRKRRAR